MIGAHRFVLVSIAAASLLLASPAGASHHHSYHTYSTRHHAYSSHASRHSHHRYYRSTYHAPGHSHAAPHHTYVHHDHSGHPKSYAYGVPRDKNGRIKRSEEAKRQFMKETGYPNGRPGYVIDHIVPLSKGGADAPSNMQWQTVEEAKAKDKVERK